jgi:uncharacterized protein YggT (Ycf19 family)
MSTAFPPLSTEEARRANQHGSIKADVVDDVSREVANRAARTPVTDEAEKLDHAAGALRRHALDEVVGSEKAVQRSRGLARLSQFLDYGFFLVYALFAIRFVLALVNARASAGFVKFIVAVTDPLYAPFRNIVESPQLDGGGRILMPVVIALLAYGVLHLAINRLLRVYVVRKTSI